MDPASQSGRGRGLGGHGAAEEPSSGPLSDEQAWETITEAGITLMRIPTPFMVGRVNTYLIEDEPLTLIDTGPNSGKALDELQHQLEALGHAIEEIELVILTHQHIDHTGLVEIIANRSGAEVAAIDLLAHYLADFGTNADLDDEHAGALMLRHGIPEDMVAGLRAVSDSFRMWGSGAAVTRELGDGQRIELRDRTLEVQLRPGHSPTDTLFWDADRRIMIGGDHLIGHISSNPLLSRPLDGGTERPRALVSYMESLSRTRELDAEIVLAGHGEPVVGHRELIDSRLKMHRRRAEKLHGLLEAGPQTAHQLAHHLWGNVAVTQAFLTISEVVGHMDLLVEQGLVEEADDGTVIRFASTGN